MIAFTCRDFVPGLSWYCSHFYFEVVLFDNTVDLGGKGGGRVVGGGRWEGGRGGDLVRV